MLLYSHKPGTGESTDFIYLGSMALAELRMAPGTLANPKTGNPPQASQVTLVPGKPPQVGGLLPAETVTTYLHANLLGSPVQWSGRAGAWMANEHYEAYGHKLNGVADKLGYTGHAHDFETELTYMQARFYDPQVGRFLSADPVEFGGTEIFALNRYSYANNNPYRYTDPTGEWPTPDTAADIAFLSADAASLGVNVASGNVVGAVTDVASIAANVVGLAVPGATGGGPLVRGVITAGQNADLFYYGSTLARNLAKAGEGVLKGIEEAHHIVLQGSKSEYAVAARNTLQKAGVKIHDAMNGVGLPKAFHSALHTKAYLQNVANRLGNAFDKGGAGAVKEELKSIKSELKLKAQCTTGSRIGC